MKLILLVKALVDILLVHAGYVLVSYGRLLFSSDPDWIRNWNAYISVAPWLTVAAIVVFYSYGFYTSSSVRQQWDEIFSGLFCALALLLLITLSISFILYQFAFPRLTMALATFVQFFLLLGWRAVIVRWARKFLDPFNIVIVGPEESALERAGFLKNDGSGHFNVRGILVDRKSTTTHSMPVYESYDNMDRVLDEVKPNSVLFCSGIPYQARMEMLMLSLSLGIHIFVVPDLYDIMIARSRLEQLNSAPAFRLTGFANGREQVWKRAMDLAFSIIFGIPALILIVLATAALKIEMPRVPVFYLQERVSRRGRIFKLYKLRTMIPDAEKHTGPVLSNHDDSRVTTVGRFLRFTRIDELPQLWNVFKGEMSFIGPRAERPVFVEQYSRDIPGYDYRHMINSGITGLAQVEGKYSTTAEDKLRFDLIYVQTFSPLKDLHILMHTIKVMLQKKRAM